ncbi:MAG: hypothetical protein JWN15_1953 [Firmicutes bacterium]|nr:hypothetical protein [Bacillota bacterium]
MARARYGRQGPVDPFGAFNFKLELGGTIEAGFSECNGLDSETDVIAYRNGDDEITVRKIPGLRKFGNITLKRGLTASLTLWKWRMDTMSGKLDRHDISIVMFDDSGTKELVRFTLRNAWPSKWVGPTLHASDNGVAVETLELVHEGIDDIETK